MLVVEENQAVREMMNLIAQCHIGMNSMSDQNLWYPELYVDFCVKLDLRISITLVDHLYLRLYLLIR